MRTGCREGSVGPQVMSSRSTGEGSIRVGVHAGSFIKATVLISQITRE